MAEEEYNKWHFERAAREQFGSNTVGSGVWYEMVRRHLGTVDGLKILEVGCGRGGFAIELAKMGAHVTAVDASPAAIGIAGGRARQEEVEIDFRVADACRIDLPSSSYDVVVSCEVLEHVSNPEAMAKELWRLCKPGGRCLVTAPSYLNGALIAWVWSWITGKPYNSGEGVQPREAFFFYFLVRRILRRAGFAIRTEESRLFRWLLLPRVDPGRLQVVEFSSPLVNRIMRPFGLHYFYDLYRTP